MSVVDFNWRPLEVLRGAISKGNFQPSRRVFIAEAVVLRQSKKDEWPSQPQGPLPGAFLHAWFNGCAQLKDFSSG